MIGVITTIPLPLIIFSVSGILAIAIWYYLTQLDVMYYINNRDLESAARSLQYEILHEGVFRFRYRLFVAIFVLSISIIFFVLINPLSREIATVQLLLALAFCVVLLYAFPNDMWINRQRSIQREVPRLVLHLYLQTLGGKPLLLALTAYANWFETSLAKEVDNIVSLIQSSASVRKAFSKIADKTGVDSFRLFIINLPIDDEMVSVEKLSKSLLNTYTNIISKELTEARREIQKKTMLALVVTVLFTLPALLAVLLVPAIVIAVSMFNPS